MAKWVIKNFNDKRPEGEKWQVLGFVYAKDENEAWQKAKVITRLEEITQIIDVENWIVD